LSELFWADKSAQQVIDRDPESDIYVTECGLGASGIPHVGSLGDGIRSYVVTLAIENKGKNSFFQAYSDDRDGLRKIPYGFPSSLKEYIGNPVSHIPDPFGCHDSFGAHISSLLTDAFDRIGIDYKFQSSDQAYNKGMLDREIMELLSKHKEAGQIIKDVTDQDKYLTQYPYFAICEECGKIYTTRVTGFDESKRTVSYVCDGEFVGKDSNTGEDIHIKGCGHEGKCDIRQGKLAWKVEFAARWKAFDIAFEAFGKDILESVKVNDVIEEKLLSAKAPVHAFYEMFVERGGGKISKSKGNVFTPQKWLSYGSPDSLVLLMLKRLAYSRVVDLLEIPKLMDEVDYLHDVYFKKEKVNNEKERSHLIRMYEYIKFLNLPDSPGLTIPYNVVANVASVIPVDTPNRDDIIINILRNCGKIPQEIDEEHMGEALRRIGYATNWLQETGDVEREKIEIDQRESDALSVLLDTLDDGMDAEKIQNTIFQTAKDHDLKPAKFFKLIYSILLGVPRGPRAGSLIETIGMERAKELIRQELN